MADRGSRLGGCSVIAAGGQDIRDVAMSSSSSDQFTTLLLRLGDSPQLLPEEKPGENGDIASNGAEHANGASSGPDDLPAAFAPTKGHFGPVHTLAFTSDGS